MGTLASTTEKSLLPYGSTYGTIAAVIGGGNSQTHPTTLSAMNNGGVIQIKARTAQKTRVLTIISLIKSGFPNPTEANIKLEDRGNSIQMTVLGTGWSFFFARDAWIGTLVKDGGGNLRLLQGIKAPKAPEYSTMRSSPVLPPLGGLLTLVNP